MAALPPPTHSLPRLPTNSGLNPSWPPAGASDDELEGGSPTSSSTMTHCKLVGSRTSEARVQPPRRSAVRWLLRRLAALQRKQDERCRDGGSVGILSGGSYGSLVGLSDGEEQQELAELWQQQPAAERQCQQQSWSPRAPAGRVAAAVLRPFVRLARALASAAGPQGPGNNDACRTEQLVNVVTSLPFILIGLHGLRTRTCPAARHFAASFVAVGASAAAYHASGGGVAARVRPLLRRADYYSICYSAAALRRAARIPLPRPLAVLAAAAAPFKPTAVTALNLTLVEVRPAPATCS